MARQQKTSGVKYKPYLHNPFHGMSKRDKSASKGKPHVSKRQTWKDNVRQALLTDHCGYGEID